MGSGTGRLVGSGTGRLVGSGANNILSFNVPLASPDGQLILFNVSNVLDNVPSTNLQKLSGRSSLPDWFTPVGNIYRYEANTTSNPQIAMQIFYFNRDVPNLAENQLQIFHLPEGGGAKDWRPLETVIDAGRNQASAKMNGNGLYALIATNEMPVIKPGWNLLGSPIVGSLSITEAISSLDDGVALIYGYDSRTDQWQAFDPSASQIVKENANSLTSLDFGRGYWLSSTITTTFYLPVTEGEAVQTAEPLQNSSMDQLNPPAFLYGNVAGFITDLPIEFRKRGTTETCWTVTISANQASWSTLLPAKTAECDLAEGDLIELLDAGAPFQTITWTNQRGIRVDLVP